MMRSLEIRAAVTHYGDEQLCAITRDLVRSVSENATIDSENPNATTQQTLILSGTITK
jgi:hypothetical protein